MIEKDSHYTMRCSDAMAKGERLARGEWLVEEKRSIAGCCADLIPESRENRKVSWREGR